MPAGSPRVSSAAIWHSHKRTGASEDRSARAQDGAKALEPERFHPSVLKVSTGHAYEIRHPQREIVGRSAIAVETQRRNGLRFFERRRTVDRFARQVRRR